MGAARLLRVGPSGLGSLRSSTPLGGFFGPHFRLLHSTSFLLRREPSSSGPRWSTGASARSSSSRQTGSHSSSSSASNPAKKTSTRPAPASVASVSGTPRHHRAKVEVIPFRIPTKAAREYLTTLAATEVMPRVMSRWSMLKHQLLSLIGIKSMSDTDGEIVKLNKMTALYLPTWIVDASFEIKCRGNDGRAEANFIITSSRFPGHSWKPMDSMPMLPPPPHDMIPTQVLQKDPNYAANTRKAAWDNLAMVDYESYESHLKRKADSTVKIDGGIPDPLPFTISPLFLVDMLRKKLKPKDLTFTPDLTDIKLPAGDTHGLGPSFVLANENGERITPPPVHFEPDTLKLHMMAAYPVLMPLHLARFSYKDAEGVRHNLTMVLGAWDTNGLQICSKEKDQDWQWTFPNTKPFKIEQLDLYPGAPIKTSLNEMFERQREKERAKQRERPAQEADEASDKDGSRKARKTRQEWMAEWEREKAASQEALQADLKLRMAEKFGSELSIKTTVEKRSVELLQRADWIHCLRDEREAFETRTSSTNPATEFLTDIEKERYEGTLASARTAPTEPRPFQWLSREKDRKAELEHPDRKAGLGRYIHWSSPHVQRLSHNVYANRRYLTEAISGVLNSRKRIASLAESGHDVDRLLISAKRKDGTKVSGEQAYNTVIADDISIRQLREALKPRWLKALEQASRR